MITSCFENEYFADAFIYAVCVCEDHVNDFSGIWHDMERVNFQSTLYVYLAIVLSNLAIGF